MLDVLEPQLLDEEMDHLAIDGNALDKLLVGLCDTALLEELLGLLVGMGSQAFPLLRHSRFHGQSGAIEHQVWLDPTHLEGA